MVDFLQQMTNGLVTGSTYALVALGLTLIYGILHIPHFAHGQSYMWAAYGMLLLMSLGINYWIVMLIISSLFIVLGMVMERIVFKPLASQSHINGFIAAIGLMMVLESMALIAFGPEFKQFPPIHKELISLGDIVLTQQRVICIIGSVSLIILLYLFINYTHLGEAIHAIAQDSEGAKLVGINVKFNTTVAFGLGTGLAGMAAALISPIFVAFPQMGGMLNLKAFVIIVLGSMGNLVGAVIGGYAIGIIEAMVSGYFSAAYKDFFAFIVLIVILLVKPAGLFGGKQ
jgi:branched-chain amino acid transport system permease protein